MPLLCVEAEILTTGLQCGDVLYRLVARSIGHAIQPGCVPYTSLMGESVLLITASLKWTKGLPAFECTRVCCQLNQSDLSQENRVKNKGN